MPAKLAALTVILILLAAALLVTRQQRIDTAHRTASLRASLERLRYEVWQAQTDAMHRLNPDQLRRRIDHVNLALEPAVPPFGNPDHRPALFAHRTPSR